MKNLPEFLMEEWLEKYRFQATFNFGESGGPIRTVRDLLTLSGMSEHEASVTLLETRLNDSPNWGHPELREQISKIHVGTTVENILVTTGTSEALFLLFRQIRPKKIAMAWPAFQLLYEIPKTLNTEVVKLPVQWDANLHPYVDENEWFEILKQNKPDCILINNPHNPSGLEFSPSFLQKIVDYCTTHSVTLIGDEHYRFLSSQGSPCGPSLLDFAELKKTKIFITGSFIKCIGCPGIRVGWCVGDHNILSAMQSEKNYTTHTVNPITELLSRTVLRNLNSPLWNETREIWKKNRKALSQWIKWNPNWKGITPTGGWVTVLAKNCSTEKLLENSIFLLPLHSMETPTIQNLTAFRIGLGAPPPVFEQGLKILENF